MRPLLHKTQCKPKGYGDVEIIVTADPYDAYPEDIISRFDLDICKAAYYFDYGFDIPTPKESFWGTTGINQDRGRFVVNYMIALKKTQNFHTKRRTRNSTLSSHLK